jgi:peptide/nickel transport system substrate-binding protein
MNAHQYRTDAPSRRRLLQSGVGLAAGSAAAWLLACGGSKKEEAKATTAGGAAQGTAAAAATATAAPKRGGRLKQAYTSSTTSLNPITDSGQRLSLGALHLWDRLVSPRITKDYVLEAAQSVELPDQTTVVFKLKPGLKFQDRAPVSGRAVDTEDIVKSQIYVRDEPRGAGNNAFQRNSMQSMETPDAQTIVFKLKAPNAYIFSGTQLGDPGAQCIFAKEQVGSLDTAWSVGSGPYEMVEYEMNVRYLYRRFAGFRDAGKGLPYVEEREWRVIQDTAAQEAAFRSEQIHLWTLPLTNLADPLKRELGGRIEMDEYLALSMQTISANATRPPFNDVRVREALYRVANRKQYLDLIQDGRGKVPPGPVPVGLTDYQLTEAQTEKYFRQDAKAAKQLLDAAGFPYDKEIEASAINRPQDTQGCEILQQQLSQVGVKVRVLPLPLAEWLQGKMATGNWEAFVAYWPGYDTPQFPLRMHHTESQPAVHRYHGLKDPTIDKMIEKSEVTLDKNERIKLVKDIQIALMEKYTPVIYTQNNTTYQARWKYVRDYEINPATHPMYRTEMWLDR